MNSNLSLKPCRTHYSDSVKMKVANIYRMKNKNIAETLDIVHKISGYEKVSKSMISRWEKQFPSAETGEPPRKKLKPGPKTANNFEIELKMKLMGEFLEEGKDKFVSVAYSYEIIRTAAMALRDAQYPEDYEVKNKMFTNKWVQGFMKRQNISRRRVTSDSNKPNLSQSIINDFCNDIRNLLVQEEIKNELVFNGDETGICLGTCKFLLISFYLEIIII